MKPDIGRARLLLMNSATRASGSRNSTARCPRAQPATRVRFNLHLEFATDHAWRELSVRVATRPSVWTIHATAADQRLDLKYEDETGHWTRAFAFDELRDPRKWIEEFDGPLPPSSAGHAGPVQSAPRVRDGSRLARTVGARRHASERVDDPRDGRGPEAGLEVRR